MKKILVVDVKPSDLFLVLPQQYISDTNLTQSFFSFLPRIQVGKHEWRRYFDSWLFGLYSEQKMVIYRSFTL